MANKLSHAWGVCKLLAPKTSSCCSRRCRTRRRGSLFVGQELPTPRAQSPAYPNRCSLWPPVTPSPDPTNAPRQLQMPSHTNQSSLLLAETAETARDSEDEPTTVIATPPKLDFCVSPPPQSMGQFSHTYLVEGRGCLGILTPVSES
jgi:hypothetical protein